MICFSCQKDEGHQTLSPLSLGYEEVTIQDPHWDWCTSMFQHTDTKYLEAINLSDFIDSLVVGKLINIKYQEDIIMSICTGREKIKILGLKAFSPYSIGWKEVTFQNQTGTNGCGFVFQQIDTKWMQPVNKSDFKIDYTNGKKYWLKYEIAVDWVAICNFPNKELIKIIDFKNFE